MITIRHEHHIHFIPDQDAENHRLLKLIFNQNKTIMGALEDVKAKLATSNEKIDLLGSAVTEVAAVVPEVAKDVAFIKAKLEAQPGGIDAAGVAELLQIVTDQDTKVTGIADSLSTVKTSLQELDAQTDSSEV